MEEEQINFSVPKRVFYNSHMRFCRSIASLAVGAIDEKIELCDAFCASGIRGIRYAKENQNVKKITFLDINRNATSAAKKNAQKNKIKTRTAFTTGNISRLVFDIVCDFAEIDPFGSPVPYLYDSFRFFNPLKHGYLSVTATDVAVTCGGKAKACLKNYHSKPLNNEFTHETGIRILLKKIAETAAEFNMGIEPLFSLSHRHYQKVLVKCVRIADAADKTMRSLGYVNYCESCGWRESSQFPVSGPEIPQNFWNLRQQPHGCQCPESNRTKNSKPETQDTKHRTLDTKPWTLNTGHRTLFAGPLWLGELHNNEFLKRMGLLNAQRNYTDKLLIEKTLMRMKEEVGMPPYYFNLSKLCQFYKIGQTPKFEIVIKRLHDSGYRAARTHFCESSIKSDAPLHEIKKCLTTV